MTLTPHALSTANHTDALHGKPMIRDVLRGLRSSPRTLPTQYLYDTRGSALFEQITELPEYYLTRTELAIFDEHLADMADHLGPEAWLIEIGSGMGTKTHRLLDAMHRPAGYTPIEISPSAMNESLAAIQRSHPGVRVEPLRGDFTRDLTLPDTGEHRRVVFFPGSTIGNFDHAAARQLLARIRRWVGPDGALLIGIDLVKPASLLVPAYDDARGVTAAFNLNLLDRLNREAGADFDLRQWAHRAVWNADRLRMESYLVSQRDQHVRVAGEAFDFAEGEAVRTEQSQKYTVESFLDLCPGMSVRAQWRDASDWCAVLLLEMI